MVDTADSKSAILWSMGVQVPPRAPPQCKQCKYLSRIKMYLLKYSTVKYAILLLVFTLYPLASLINKAKANKTDTSNSYDCLIIGNNNTITGSINCPENNSNK